MGRTGNSHSRQFQLVCLSCIFPGESTETKIYIDADTIPGERHHYRPSSRQGKTVVNIDPITHWAWHVLFGNDFVEEVIVKIKYAWPDKRGRIKEEYLLGRIEKDVMGTKYDKRLLAWYTIFGQCRNPKKAIKIIRKIFAERRRP